MYGRCAFDIWVEKYGIEEANKRKKLQYEKQLQSRKNRGIHENTLSES